MLICVVQEMLDKGQEFEVIYELAVKSWKNFNSPPFQAGRSRQLNTSGSLLRKSILG